MVGWRRIDGLTFFGADFNGRTIKYKREEGEGWKRENAGKHKSVLRPEPKEDVF